MNSIVVTVHCPKPHGELMLELPVDVPVGEFLPRLVDALHLPGEDGAGTPIPYQLWCGDGGALEADDCLSDAEIQMGDTLILSDAREGREASEEASKEAEDGEEGALFNAPAQLSGTFSGYRGRGFSAGARDGRGSCVALWSGPAGGTGCSTLALALAVALVERGDEAALLALAEPALSALCGLPRVPNVSAFFTREDLGAAQQSLAWVREGERFQLPIILGPARPRDGVVRPERIGALLEALVQEGRAVVADLPSLPPGGNAWVLEPLRHATDIVLVGAPSVTGIAALVEALAVLRDLGTDARVSLVVNRPAPGGLAARRVVDGVTEVWGACPELVAEIEFQPDLPGTVDAVDVIEQATGETSLAEAMQVLCKAIGSSVGSLVS